MPKKLLTTNEFDSLQLPIKFTFKISEACRHVFVNGESFTNAAKLNGINDTKEIELLFAAIQIINKYLEA